MNFVNNRWLFGLVGFIVGGAVIGLCVLSGAVLGKHYKRDWPEKKDRSMAAVMKNMHGGHQMGAMCNDKFCTGPSGMDMSMNGMTEMLEGKEGDAFDKAFLDMMIDHHQGAVDMANLAKQNAKHDEIKKMADEIISAQTKEIEMMRAWEKQWKY